MKPFLTIGFASRNDPGLWYVSHALVMYHPEILDQIEIVVVDNSANPRENLTELLHPKVRYIRVPEGANSSCLWKQFVINESQGEFVLICDAHVLFPPGSLKHLIDFFQQNKECNDLIMGPIMHADHVLGWTQQKLYEWETHLKGVSGSSRFGIWSNGGSALGAWAYTDGVTEASPPFEIMQQGTGAFAFRRKTFPGFLPSFLGQGGNETYLMERYRERGDKVLCAPFLRWLHNFDAPKHKSTTTDRVRNYLTTAVDLDRPDLYDATIAWMDKCPGAVEALTKIIDRPIGLWEELTNRYPTDGGSIYSSLFHELRRSVKSDSKTLEFGSGLSTVALAELSCDHTAIENCPNWFQKAQQRAPQAKIIFSNLVNGWYDWQPNRRYDVILIDGPKGKDFGGPGRSGVLSVLPRLIHDGTKIILDDTHREEERSLSVEICKLLNFDSLRRNGPGGRSFDVFAKSLDYVSVPLEHLTLSNSEKQNQNSNPSLPNAQARKTAQRHEVVLRHHNRPVEERRPASKNAKLAQAGRVLRASTLRRRREAK